MFRKINFLLFVTLILQLAFLAPAAGSTVPWGPDTAYKAGDQVTYLGSLYQCIQAHTSLPGWEPPNTPALWVPVSVASPTLTATPGIPSATPRLTFTPTRTVMPPSATPTAAYGTPTCPSPAWDGSAVYRNGMTASYGNHEWKARWWTQGEQPGTTGTWGVWEDLGLCSASAPTATATPPSGITPTATPLHNAFPGRIFGVYADISFTSSLAALQASGQKYYALAFVLGQGGNCTPAWDGTHPMSENYYAVEIDAIRLAGGNVIAVFGGANGSDIASVCTTVSSLQAAYQAVIHQYRFTWIDLNVEGSMVADYASVDRRNKALAALQAANPGLKVSFTLPVMQSGLLQTALDLLSNAKANGVHIDYVNVMAMNYGAAGVDMGQAAISAATHTHEQMISLGISTQIGITPMIGQNNTYGEIFDLEDADQLISYAGSTDYVGWLSFWSLGRDNGGCPGQTAASASCSGIAQNAYDFTNKFKLFP